MSAVKPKASGEEASGESTTNDEQFARELQDQLIREQEERDAEFARQLHQEERSKVMPAQMQYGRRPQSATPIRQLFTTMFGLRPEALEVEDESENTTPAMDPDSLDANQATVAGITPARLQGVIAASGGRGEARGLPGRRCVNRSPERARRGGMARGGLDRSPERAAARGRAVARAIRSIAQAENSTNTGDTTESSEESPTDLLPGVRVNPARQQGATRGARRFGPGRRFVFHQGPGPVSEQPEPTQPNVRPIAPPTLGLGPRQATMDLPDGEYDPDFMVLDLGENEVQREANFANITRDPFLLMLLLMGRNPGLMVPDDVDTNDYESLWELAERIGEVRGRGMKEAEINRLPCRTYRKKAGSKETESCSICISEYKTAENVQILPCKHEFHKECLVEWLKRNASCPVCRQDVKKK